jgi:LPXTG-motif cell wall-anchored protein
MKLLRLPLLVAIMLVGLATLAAPSGAQTPTPDYTPVCTPGSVLPECQPTDVQGTQVVQGDQAVAGEALARTGSDSAIPLARIGLVLLAAGGLVVLLARRRHDAKAAAG